ncbi:hypothetical protein [Actinomyces bowdenii]|uniref:Uncharacterized protein n=1 Tax=Actinomyces bowdenii TaxID=131109 RepID=A0A3P1V9C0_9ACTO|nr:hypothetical protein [Actinomyces bowdenii]RRD29965.1 hypothetical protein EII10_04565 [Actinomyces bowdenii]
MDSDSDSTAEDASHPEVPARAGAPIPAPPGGLEEGGGEGQGRRRSWAERTRSLGGSLYLLQGPMVLLLPLWTFSMRAVIPGWYSAFYIILFLPMIIIGQLLIWGMSAWANRRRAAKRMTPAMAWGYLVFLICFFLLPLILPDDDDQGVVDSALTAVGVDHMVALTISQILMAVGIAAGAVALFSAQTPADDQSESAPLQ